LITRELIERINYLARKQRYEGLTPEEKEEQQTVRQEYLAAIRARVKNVLDAVVVVDEPGERHLDTCTCSHCQPPEKPPVEH